MKCLTLLLGFLMILGACTQPLKTESNELIPQSVQKDQIDSPTILQPVKEEKQEKPILPQVLLTFDHTQSYGAVQPEKVSFTTDDGIKITASYFEPKNVPAPTVILVHMTGRTRGDYSKFAKALQEKGFAVLTYDIRGHGQSVYHNEERISQLNFQDVDWQKIPWDLKAAKKFLLKREQMSSLAIMGSGIGANAALIYAAEDEDIDTVLLLSPTIETKGLETFSPLEKYGERPILIAVSDADIYSAESSVELDRNAKGAHKLLVYRGQESGSDMLLAHTELDDEILTWLSFFLTV